MYTLDSARTVAANDTISYSSARIGRTVPITAAYFHRGSSTLTMLLHDVPNIFLRGVFAISIPTISNGTYVTNIDSVVVGTLSLVASSGDTVRAPSYTTYLTAGTAHTSINFLCNMDSPFGNLITPGLTLVFIKQ